MRDIERFLENRPEAKAAYLAAKALPTAAEQIDALATAVETLMDAIAGGDSDV